MGRARTAAVLTLVALSGFLTMLDNTVINVSLPTVQRELGLSVADLEWVATAYILSFGTLLLAAGRLSDLLGRRWALAVGLVVFVLASLAAGLATSGGTLIAARAVQGVGAALVTPASLAVITADLPERRRALAVGMWTAALAAALALGPVVGGLVTEHWGWSWVFLLNLPVGALALLLVLAVPAASRPAGGGLLRVLDLPGVVLSGVALFCLTYGLVEGGSNGFSGAPVPQYLAVACGTGLVFLAVEARRFLPLVDPRVLRVRSLSGGIAAQVMWGVGINGVFFFTALYLQQVLAFSPVKAGLVFLPLAVALLATTPGAEHLSRFLGAHRVIALGMVLIACGLWYVSRQGAEADFGTLQPGLVTIGVGSALCTPVTVHSVADVLRTRTGMASGLVSAAREISGVFGIALVGAVLGRRQRAALADGAHPRDAFLDGYDTGLQLAAGCVLFGALIALVALRRPGRHRGRGEAPARRAATAVPAGRW